MKNFCKRLGRALYRTVIDIVLIPIVALFIVAAATGITIAILLGLVGIYLYSILANIYSIFDEDTYNKQQKKIKNFFKNLGD